MRVLVTGASGFIGSALLRRLASDARWQVRACSRSRPEPLADGVEWTAGPGLGPDADWQAALEDVEVVVHLAGRAHVQRRSGPASDAEFHRVNVQGTQKLAQQAAAGGVRRFVFLSSVKVHGESGRVNEASPPAPGDAYGRSKRDAENALHAIAGATGLEVVVIRPPLVYGPGVKANFRSLLSAVRRGVPLPLGSIANRRSLVGIDNLVDLIVVCLDHSGAASETFLVSDGEDLSTPALTRRLAIAAGRKGRLVPVPVWGLRFLGAVTGKGAAVARLTESLHVDISKAQRLLGWVPPVSVDEELRRTAEAP